MVHTDIKHCFQGLSRTCKDQIPGFSMTQKNAFSWSFQDTLHSQTWLHEVKKCTYKISFRRNCITVNKPKCNICGCINVLQWTQNSPVSSVTGSLWHAPVRVHSTKCRHQSPEWVILSQDDCFIQAEVKWLTGSRGDKMHTTYYNEYLNI